MRKLVIKIWSLLLLSALACEVPQTLNRDSENNECMQSECWDPQYYVCRDGNYIEYFTRTSEWTGGDATYSIELGNEKRLWLFGDTFIDQVNSDGSRPSFKLINNSLVIEEGEAFTTFYSGTRSNPESFLTPIEAGRWYWPADGAVVNDTLYLFMHGFGNDTGGAWDFYRTSVDLAKLNSSTLEVFEVIRLFEQPEISWGAAVFESNDYTYIYGVKSANWSKRAYVARTTTDFNTAWEYFDGSDWTLNELDAADILDGVSEQFSVFEKGGHYYLLTQHNGFGFEIYLYELSNPAGGIVDKKVIYCTPESMGDIFTYNALAHPEVYSDSLLISYNVNSFNFIDLLKDVNNYRPYFIKVGNWQNN